MSTFNAYEYRTQPWFDQNRFEGANQVIPMKTLVTSCFDPGAAEIPQKVAEYLGDEVYPGENILDEAGNRVGITRTLLAEANAGGRAAALLSVAAMDYIFSVKTSSWFTTGSAARRLIHRNSSSRSSMIITRRTSRRCSIVKV